jgi:hypothetical protein
MNLGETDDALGAALDTEPSLEVKARLAAMWPTVRDPLHQALEARMRDRVASLGNLLAERQAKELGDITTVLGELERVIRAEITEPGIVQLELFSSSERDQYSRNMDALRARLEQIPQELEQETAAIRARYADPQPRLFPVAVTFLVPTSLA